MQTKYGFFRQRTNFLWLTAFTTAACAPLDSDVEPESDIQAAVAAESDMRFPPGVTPGMNKGLHSWATTRNVSVYIYTLTKSGDQYTNNKSINFDHLQAQMLGCSNNKIMLANAGSSSRTINFKSDLLETVAQLIKDDNITADIVLACMPSSVNVGSGTAGVAYVGAPGGWVDNASCATGNVVSHEALHQLGMIHNGEEGNADNGYLMFYSTTNGNGRCPAPNWGGWPNYTRSDTNSQCSAWASTNECARNPNYMLPNCSGSCTRW